MNNINKEALLKQFNISDDAGIFQVRTYGYGSENTNLIGVKKFISLSKKEIIKPYPVYTNLIYDFDGKKTDILPLVVNKNKFIKDIDVSWVYTNTFHIGFHILGKLTNLKVNEDNTLSPEFEDIVLQFIMQEDLENKTISLTNMGQVDYIGSFINKPKIVVNADDKPVKPFNIINTNIIDKQFVR